MRKLFLAPFALSMLFLAACSSTNAPTGDSTSSSSNDAIPVEGTSVSSADQTSSDASVGDTLGDARIIDMTVTEWKFDPAVITLKKGEKVVIRITGMDGVHSFGSRELGINVPINPGETKDIEIPTDKAGTFDFRCMIPCGPGHEGMTGQIIIEA